MISLRSAVTVVLTAGIAWVGQTGAAVAQRLGQATDADVPIWRVIGALVFCLVLAAAAAFLLRSRLRGGLPSLGSSSRRLILVESLRLSNQVDVCLLRCDDQHFLIAATPHGATVIAREDALAPPANAP